VPHHGGGNIGVVAHLHLVASWPNAPYLELLHEPPIGDYRHRFAMMSNAPQVKDGWMELPQGPGLGVEIDKSMVAK
jgi:galactonate dehydratase